eukprot:4726174-Amphidinium_carterae.1
MPHFQVSIGIEEASGPCHADGATLPFDVSITLLGCQDGHEAAKCKGVRNFETHCESVKPSSMQSPSPKHPFISGLFDHIRQSGLDTLHLHTHLSWCLTFQLLLTELVYFFVLAWVYSSLHLPFYRISYSFMEVLLVILNLTLQFKTLALVSLSSLTKNSCPLRGHICTHLSSFVSHSLLQLLMMIARRLVLHSRILRENKPCTTRKLVIWDDCVCYGDGSPCCAGISMAAAILYVVFESGRA